MPEFRPPRIRDLNPEAERGRRFALPTFNSTAGIWYNPDPLGFIPPPRPFDAQSKCQLLGNPVLILLGTLYPNGFLSCFQFPLDAPVHGLVAPGNSNDLLEVPIGSGRFYATVRGEAIAFGFPNAHYLIVAARVSGSVGPPPP